MLKDAGQLILEIQYIYILEIYPGTILIGKELDHVSDYSPDYDLHN